MATTNSFATSSLIARTMTEFNDNLNYIFSTANQDHVEAFEQKSYATNGTINIKVSGYPAVQRGLAVTPSPISDLTIPYTISEEDIYNVTRDINLMSAQFDILGYYSSLTDDQEDAIVDNYAYPMFLSLMADLEAELYYKLKTSAFYSTIDDVDQLGEINNFASVQDIDTFMGQLSLPADQRNAIMNYTDAAKVSNSLQNMFNEGVNTKVTENAWVGGSSDKGNLAGLDIYRSNRFVKHTAGALAGVSGISVANISADGTELTLSGVPSVTSQLINAGDKFQLTGLYWLEPVHKDVLNRQVTVNAAQDANGDGAGNITLTLAYPLLFSGEHANVSATPVGKDVKVFPNRNVSYSYTKSGLSAVPLMLNDIHGATNQDRTSQQNCKVKVFIQGSVTEGQNIFRASQLVGTKAFTPFIVETPSIAA
jgi:hypothetical protein